MYVCVCVCNNKKCCRCISGIFQMKKLVHTVCTRSQTNRMSHIYYMYICVYIYIFIVFSFYFCLCMYVFVIKKKIKINKIAKPFSPIFTNFTCCLPHIQAHRLFISCMCVCICCLFCLSWGQLFSSS